MDELAQRFEANRVRLRAMADRMLGSTAEADDAVQEAWLRLVRSGGRGVDNLDAWLTTVVAHVCLDTLRSRKSRREASLDEAAEISSPDGDGPEYAAHLAGALGPALRVVLETLGPAERVAFVLHDLFEVPFDRIAAIVGVSAVAARQLASRARRRVQGAATDRAIDQERQQSVVAAFLAAARDGRFEPLLALLDPEVTLRADAAAVRMGAEPEIRGARAVAETFKGRAQAARLARVDGEVGAAFALGGQLRVVFEFAIAADRIREIRLVADPARLQSVELEYLDA